MGPRAPQTPGSLPRPLLLGRLVRLALGLVVVWIFVLILRAALEQPPGSSVPGLLFLPAVAGAIAVLKDLVNLGLGRSWGRRAQVATVALATALLVLDLGAYGRPWAPPLAWFLFLFTEMVFGFFAVSLLLAGLLAVPG